MDEAALLSWGKLAAACLATYFVYKDSEKYQVPYRNGWIVATFIFCPVLLLYFYYKYHLKKQRSRSNLYQREAEMRQKMTEQQIKLRAESRAWEKARREEMAKNQITEAELEAAAQKRAEEKEQRLRELAEERALQEEAAAKLLHKK